MKTHKASRSVAVAALSDDDLLTHLRAANIWDCIGWHTAGGHVVSTRLFGNANIGNLNLTNLQQAATAAFGHFVVMNWYARTNMQITPAVERFAQHSYVTLIAGNTPQWTSPLSGLMAIGGEIHRAPRWPCVLEHRQGLTVNVDTFSGASDEIAIPPAGDPNYRIGNRLIWIHLEGVIVPRELYERAEESEDSEATRRRWLHLQAKVLRLIVQQRTTAIDTAESIAQWVGSMAAPTDPDEIRAQLQSVADSIREGRWRGEQARPSDQVASVPMERQAGSWDRG